MSLNQKIFLVLLGIYVIFDFVLGSLVGLFLWDQTSESKVILTYYLILFFSIMIFSQISSYLVGLIGAKKVYILSIMLGMVQAILLLTYQSIISQLIILFGVLAGASIGMQAVAYGIVASNITSGGDATKFLGTKSSIMNLVSIVSVPLITLGISKTGSYNLSYIIGLVAGIMVISLLSRIDISPKYSPYHPIRFIAHALSSEDSRAYLKTRFVYGLFSGPVWAILGIVTFKFAGNLALWGVISTIFTILSIIGAYLYGRIRSGDIHKAYSVISTLIFATVTIILATNWNFATFLVYQFGLVILNASFSIHYENLTYAILSENEVFANNTKELLGLGEICIGLGRVIPLFALLMMGFSFQDNLLIQVLFIMIASLPLIIISLLKNTGPFRKHYAKI